MSSDGSLQTPSPSMGRVKANCAGSRLCFEDVSVGQELSSLQKQIDLPHMMAYGAATWDFIRVHYDADHARDFGFPTVRDQSSNSARHVCTPPPHSARQACTSSSS